MIKQAVIKFSLICTDNSGNQIDIDSMNADTHFDFLEEIDECPLKDFINEQFRDFLNQENIKDNIITVFVSFDSPKYGPIIYIQYKSGCNVDLSKFNVNQSSDISDNRLAHAYGGSVEYLEDIDM
jgi:hypothetical protein